MNNIVPKKVTHVNTNKHWYSILNLIEKYPVTNKRWQLAEGAVAFEYFYGLDEQPVTDPWGRPLIPWTYAYAQPGEENHGPQEWKMDYDNTRATHRFYRYVTINGKYIKLKLIFKHE